MATERTFEQILLTAQENLWGGFERAKVIRHTGSKGTARENSLAIFLQSQLPDRFCVTTGEAVDSQERRTGQLDVVIYDRNRTVPLLSEESSDVLPAECLLAVIEVKSKLTQDELNKCARAAKAISDLRPYGQPFLAARRGGADADDGRHRCLFSVIAYETDLSATSWVNKEWARINLAITDAEVSADRVDRVLVLNRGIIVPPTSTGRSTEDGQGMLQERFMHLSNFLVREAERRPAFDFQRYALPSNTHTWGRLEVSD